MINENRAKWVFGFTMLIIGAAALLPQQPKFLNMQKMVFYYSKSTNEYYLAATAIDDAYRCGRFDTNDMHVILEMGNEKQITIRNDDLKILCLGTMYNKLIARNITLFRFTLVIDNSGSIDPTSLKFVQNTLTKFVSNMPVVYEAKVIRFSDTIQLKTPFLKDKQELIRHVNEPKPQGNTALFDAIIVGVQELIDPEFEIPLRFTVVLTDGKDNRSNISRDEFKHKIIRMCRENYIPLFIVGVTDEVDSQLLEEITKFGMFQHIKRFPNIDRAFDLILKVIKDTYIIKIPSTAEFQELKTIFLVKEFRAGKFETIQDFVIH